MTEIMCNLNFFEDLLNVIQCLINRLIIHGAPPLEKRLTNPNRLD